MQRLGVIDLGTNSARLLVADVCEDGELSVVASHRVACRMGEGLSESGRIEAEAEARTAIALRKLVQAVEELGDVPLRVIATHALRAAANGTVVQGRLEECIGMPISVISGEREAHLVLGAAQHLLAAHQESLVALDLGGGSLEFAVQPFHAAHAIVPQLLSLPLGSVLMSDGMTSGVVPQQETAALAERVRQVLHSQGSAVGNVAPRVVGAGGTVVCVAALLGFPSPWNGVRFSTDALNDVVASLASMDFAERAALPAVGDRADIIVAGVIVLQEALRHLGATECVVLEYGVRAGALLALAKGEL